MFDFLDSDWFIISLEVIFLLLMAFDIKRYFETKKKEYITNIVLTFGFFIWTSIPFYNSYITWNDKDKIELISKCNEEMNATICTCIDNNIFKEFSFNTYTKLKTTNDDELKQFIKEIKEECLDD